MNTVLRGPAAVKWLPWSHAAFERARAERKVVLLSLAAAWSHACRQMDEDCYGDREVAGEINTWVVPIRVDADKRPDIAERYELGGLPTTAFLDADGQILGGGTYVERERLMSALSRLHEAGALSTPNSQLLTPKESDPFGEVSLGVGSWKLGVDELTSIVFSTFDDEHGGFGTAPKFPLVAPVRLALHLYQESATEKMGECAARTLDTLGWGPLYDEAHGGFFRCAESSDWAQPQREKLLVTNAHLLDLFLEAGVAMGNERWLERAADTLEYVQSALVDVPGEGWRASENSDRTRLSDANARMASAALHASHVFGDRSLGELALHSLESVLLAGYRPGQGIAHCASGVRGLLGDQITMLNAQMDAWDATGDVVYKMMAQELAQFAIRTMWDPERGVFFDRADSAEEGAIGLLGHRVKPFVLNCEAAEALERLSRAAEEPALRRVAEAALDAVHPRAAAQGPLAAHYVLARRAVSQ